MVGPKSMPKLGAIILAAGMSRRMGQPKLLLPFKKKPLFRHVVEVAVNGDLEPVILIGGEHTEELRKHTKDLPNIEIIINPNYSKGMASSLKPGIKAVKDRTDGVIVFLADQPFVSPIVVKTLMQLYEFHRTKGIRIVRPQYNGMVGHPILFDAQLYDEFKRIQGDEGGRSIIKGYINEVLHVPFRNPIWGIDIDTPEDLLYTEHHFP
jgi:molybdenum cofactor cytidylyltransferase